MDSDREGVGCGLCLIQRPRRDKKAATIKPIGPRKKPSENPSILERPLEYAMAEPATPQKIAIGR